ncbi:glutamate racemase [Roseibium sp.]|uniref:glutamate racemase n=1 Tax=Roseibium sp. TaxID=1936156 RepID=UPI003A97C435
MSRPVLFFDSGLGGLTVLREARLLLPERRFVYVADDAGFPYGAWEEDALLTRLLSLFEVLLKAHDPEAVVIACNTAFTLAGAALRVRFPDTRFVGTVPAIKPAAERTQSGQISVLATPGTVRRAYTRDLIRSFADRCAVKLVGSEKLAICAEAFLKRQSVDEAVLRAEISPCFVTSDDGQTDIVVLACTHYPFLAGLFRKLAPWPVDWLDPAEAIARQLRRVVPDVPFDADAHFADQAVFTSGEVSPELARLLSGFGLKRPPSLKFF